MSTQDEGLPPEIIERILYCLPVKSLGRFKCVSNPWRSLISKPQFVKSHLHKHNRETNLLLISGEKSLHSVDLDEATAAAKELSFQPPVRWEEICGSCDGLVLAKDVDDALFLLNPTTRELAKLPDSPFALPPRESHVMYGLGFDSSGDDYKVVSISFWDTDNEHNPDCTDMFVNLYSRRSNVWRSVDNSPYDHAVGHLVSGVFLNGNLHWLASRVEGYSSAIVAFNLAGEKFTEVPLPESIPNDKAVFNELVVLGGKLAVFGSLLGSDLWVMEEYGASESWTKISMAGIQIDPIKPVCLLTGGDRKIVLGDEDEILVYNVEEETSSALDVHLVPQNGFFVAGSYIESLVSIS